MDDDFKLDYKILGLLVFAGLWTWGLPRILTYWLLGSVVDVWSTFFLVGYPLILALCVGFFNRIRDLDIFIKKTLIFYIFFNTFFLVNGLYKTLPERNSLANKTFSEVYEIWNNSFFAFDYYMNNYLHSLKNNEMKISYGKISSIRDVDSIEKYLSIVEENSLLSKTEISSELTSMALDSLNKELMVNKFYQKYNFDDITKIINNENFQVKDLSCGVANNIVESYISEKNVNHNRFYEILYVFENKRTKCINKDILNKNKKLIAENKNNFWYRKLKNLNPYFDGLLKVNTYE